MKKNSQDVSVQLYRSLLIYSVVGTLIIGAIIAAVSIVPLSERMKEYQQDSVKHAIHTRLIAVRQFISRASEVATQVTSRTKAREGLEAYNRNEIDAAKLDLTVKPLLVEAVQRSADVVGLLRFDAQRHPVIAVGQKIPEHHWVIPEGSASTPAISGPVEVDGVSYIVVGASIVNPQKERVGTDVILFKLAALKPIIDDLTGLGTTGEAILFKVLDGQASPVFPLQRVQGNAITGAEQALLLQQFNSTPSADSETTAIFRDSSGHDYIIVSSPIKELSWLLAIRIDKNELYANITEQIALIVAIIVALMLIGALIMALLLRPLAGRVMIHTDELEQQVQEKSKKIGQILQSIGDAFISLDRDYRVTYANSHVENMFAVKEDDLVGKDVWARLPEVAECFLTGMQQASNGNVSVRMESYYAANHSWLAAHIYPLEEGLSIYLHDITRRKIAEQELIKEREEQKKLIERLKEAQNQLLQSEKMASIGQLAAGIAHEINNPIGFINSNIGTLRSYVLDLLKLVQLYEASEEQLKEGPTAALIQATKVEIDLPYLKDDVKSLLDESHDGVMRVKRIVQDLKDFSHVDEAEWQQADLHSGLESTLNIVNNEIKYKAEVIKAYGELPLIECVPSQINQVFMNLLVNAAQAIEEHGTITIRTGTSADDNGCWIEVEDSGKGIEAAHLTRIFEPFFTTKPVGTGTGLGLSLSYGIIEKHQGKLEVRSTVGQGTCFRIWLPINRPPKP